MNLTPLPKRVLLRPIVERPNGLIQAPTASDFTPTKATVITCGADCHQVKPGDVVEITEYHGMPCEIDGVPHLVMKETAILGIHPPCRECGASPCLCEAWKANGR